MECYRHPGTASSAACVGCGKAICEACRQEVAGHAMCAPCVEVAQARLSSQAAPAAQAEVVPSAAPGSWAQDSAAVPAEGPEAAPGADSGFAVPPSVEVPEKLAGFPQYVKAFLLSGVVAVLGAIVWDKFTLWTGFSLGLIAIALGWAVGTAINVGAEGRPGRFLPVLGALMAAFSILLGHTLLLDDVAMKNAEFAAQAGKVPQLIRLPLLAPLAVQNLSIMGWVILAIGVWEGWTIPRRP